MSKHLSKARLIIADLDDSTSTYNIVYTEEEQEQLEQELQNNPNVDYYAIAELNSAPCKYWLKKPKSNTSKA
jgi:hypothetical protein